MSPDPVKTYFNAFRSGLRPDPFLTVSEWADRHRYLPKKASAEPGKYRTDRTPYLREIMDTLSPFSPVQEVVVMKSTQVGCTEAANNLICYVIDVAPGPLLMVLPTQELAKDHSRQKLQPSIEITPRLKEKVKPAKSRDGANTLQVKEFPGGVLFISGSNSGAFFRSKSVRYLILDDIDGFELDVAGEGDPVELARRRTDSFGNRRKIFEISTPTIAGVSRIEKSFNESDQRFYHVPCPRCGEFQKLEFGAKDEFGIQFTWAADGILGEVWYKCLHCAGRIDEGEKTAMLAAGKWIPTFPDRPKRGYHISSLYSPAGWVSWRQVAVEFLAARKSKERLKTWRNTREGLPFEEEGDQPAWADLKARCLPYEPLTVPSPGLLLAAGVDTQDDRLVVVIRAFGKAEESWLVYHVELHGDPGQPKLWEDLAALLTRPYPHESGTMLHIVSAAIDSGGHHAQAVYGFARIHQPKVIAIKGLSQRGKPIITQPSTVDLTWRGQKVPGGASVWGVGSDTAKLQLYSRLRIEEGPGAMHWYVGTMDEYFAQLCAEKLVTRYVKGYPRQEWVMTAPRNHALDAEIYCYAAALRAGLQYIDFDALSRKATDGHEAAAPQGDRPRRRIINKGLESPYKRW